MTTTETYRVGQFQQSPSSLPSPSELYESIEDEFTIRAEEYDEERDEELVFKQKGTSPYLGNSYDEYSYCHFSYVADTPDSILIRNDEDEIEEDNRRKIEAARVLYFENGQFIFESRDDIPNGWIPGFIEEITDSDIDPTEWEQQKLSQESLTDFYRDQPQVSVLKVKQPEESSEVSSEADIPDEILELAGRVVSQRFSVGRRSNNNLKGATIVDESAEYLEILEISAKDESGKTTNLKSSGPIKISWNDDDLPDGDEVGVRAEFVRSKTKPFLERLAE